ncbi:hypothetical protein NY536_25840, partial [Enterobacter hormaechei]|nr:hypothetical protein [Enterobacter hormaechei]
MLFRWRAHCIFAVFAGFSAKPTNINPIFSIPRNLIPSLLTHVNPDSTDSRQKSESISSKTLSGPSGGDSKALDQ